MKRHINAFDNMFIFEQVIAYSKAFRVMFEHEGNRFSDDVFGSNILGSVVLSYLSRLTHIDPCNRPSTELELLNALNVSDLSKQWRMLLSSQQYCRLTAAGPWPSIKPDEHRSMLQKRTDSLNISDVFDVSKQ